jgi:hypothetical protein
MITGFTLDPLTVLFCFHSFSFIAHFGLNQDTKNIMKIKHKAKKKKGTLARCTNCTITISNGIKTGSLRVYGQAACDKCCTLK